MKEAMLYERIGHKMVQCRLCPHNCVIPEGKTGYCGVRKNRDGTLYALTYGRVASAAVDPIEKKPLYHFHPGSPTFSIGTFGCNMRCKHCQNWEISHHGAEENGEGLRELTPAELIEQVKRHRCTALAWTYNEPSIWFEYILETAKLARREGVLTVLVTSGMINPPALKALLTYVDAYRLDIKGFTEAFYERLTGNRVLAHVLENGLIAHEAGAHLEVITNVIPNWNDTNEQFDGLSKWIVTNLGEHTPWHVTAYYPSHKVTEPPTPVSTLERAKRIGMTNGLQYVYIGNISGHPGQNTICPGCGRTLIDRDGFGIGENHIVHGRCAYCGFEITGYRGPDVPFRHHTAALPQYVL
jgi:pyruvate formate lyase activating enzyme